MIPSVTAVREVALSVDSVYKRFGSVEVLRDVSLGIESAQILALLGANGSGKSTLMKIISGVIKPSSGQICWDEERSSGFRSPADAAAIGIRVVHQEAPLIDSLSVLEAIAMFRGYGTSGISPIKWRALRRGTAALLERMDIDIDLGELCARLRPADRAGVALAIAVGDQFDEQTAAAKLRLLLLDEMTAAIPDRDADRHLARVRRIAEAGIAVVMVTHRLGELRIADDIVVLRGGEIVYRENGGQRRDITELVDEVMGSASEVPTSGVRTSAMEPRQPVRELWQSSLTPDDVRIAASGDVPPGGESLVLEEIVGQDLRGVSLRVRPGEVIGFMGLAQEGLSELPGILSGAVRRSSGSIVVDGHALSAQATPRDFIGAGMMAVPADRLREGGAATLTTEENVILPSLGEYWHRRARREAVVQGVIDAFEVTPRTPKSIFGSLSGGNQQKVLLGKWLALRPKVLVLDDPTHGIDPGARETVFAAIFDAARLGVCVLFFSTEPEQLVRMCKRVLVIRGGRIDTELSGAELSEETVVKWSYI